MAKHPKPEIPADEDRLYAIAPEPAYQIVTGLIGDRQVLVFPLRGAFLMLRFSKDGNMLDSTQQSVPVPSAAAQIRADWLAAQGFKSRSIKVKRFYLPEFNLGIKQIPDSMREALEEPEQFHPDELEQIYHDIPGWIEDGLFVLCWNEDYYADANGKVISS
jgi:hypothetical protein